MYKVLVHTSQLQFVRDPSLSWPPLDNISAHFRDLKILGHIYACKLRSLPHVHELQLK